MTDEKQLLPDPNALYRHDWVLEMLIKLVNGIPPLSVSITLQIDGGVLTGTLIGFREYFVELGKVWNTMLGGGEPGEGISKTFAKYAEDEFTKYKNRTLADQHHNYVHLKDARLVFGHQMSPPYPQKGFLWRGKLKDVNGFAIGALAPAPAQSNPGR